MIKFPTDLQNFTDLCSVANVSLLIFDNQAECHGYYIHGLNPVGASEGTIEDLKLAFMKEEKGNCRGRGLVSNDPEGLQTFEIYYPNQVKKTYDKVPYRNLLI